MGLGQDDTQQAKIPSPAEERVVEALLPVTGERLGLHLFLDETHEGLCEQHVLRRGCEEVESPPAGIGLHRLAPPDPRRRPI